MGKEYRTYHDNSTHHVYCNGIDGNIIFYSVQDCIFYITLYYHLSRKYGIVTRAFTIMPNHIHSNEQAPSQEDFFCFHRDLNKEFTRVYNKEHNRTGPLFMKPFGFAPKSVAKKIRENIVYILNNPIVGRLAKSVDQYKWNLMAYRLSDYPFSQKIVLKSTSRRLRRSVEMLKHYFNNGLPLTYERQKVLFKNLSSDESAQLTDLILSLHNFLDYNTIGQLYDGDVENAIIAARSYSGTDHEIKEDYEDYRAYQKMMRLSQASGIDLKTCNFESMSSKELKALSIKFLANGIDINQIQKFLHLPRDRH